MDKQYMTLSIPNTDMQVIVKLDDEGVVVDVTDKDNDEPIASTWKMYTEMGVDVVKTFNSHESWHDVEAGEGGDYCLDCSEYVKTVVA